MDYTNETEFTLYKKGANFSQALMHKLGHAPNNIQEVISALNPKIKDKIEKEKLRLFEGSYGWAYTTQYGRAGEVTMLTKDDL